MKYTKKSIILLGITLFSLSASAWAQKPRQFTLGDLAFLKGHWQGSREMGSPEEIWLPARDGVMTAFFRWPSVRGRYVLELLTATVEDKHVVFRFKHFDPDITPWEKTANTYHLTEMDGRCATLTGVDTPASVPSVMQYCLESAKRLVFRGADADTPIDKTDFVIEFTRKR